MRGTGNRPPFSYLKTWGCAVERMQEPWQTAPQCRCGRRVPDAGEVSEASTKGSRSDGAKANSRKRNGGSDGAEHQAERRNGSRESGRRM